MKKYIKIVIEVLLALIIITSIWFIINNQNKINNSKGNILNHAIATEKIEQSNTISSVGLMRSSEFKLPNYMENSYGVSENGRSLNYYSIQPETYNSTIMLVFALHGYEGNYDKDGQILADAANELVKYYKENDVMLLNEKRLIIVPCANPDGVNEGISEEAFGKLNAKQIDLDKDFNEKIIAKESKALAELVKKEKPSIVIDFHGWEDYTMGDESLGKVFKENMSINYNSEKENYNGTFWYWAEIQGIKSLLVEFKDDTINREDLKIAISEVLEK